MIHGIDANCRANKRDGLQAEFEDGSCKLHARVLVQYSPLRLDQSAAVEGNVNARRKQTHRLPRATPVA